VTIGRTAENDVVLSDPAVSRHHASIRQVDGLWVIEDLGSGNGTLVNGEVIDTPSELDVGDAVTIGPVTFTVETTTDALALREGQAEEEEPEVSLARRGRQGLLAPPAHSDNLAEHPWPSSTSKVESALRAREVAWRAVQEEEGRRSPVLRRMVATLTILAVGGAGWFLYQKVRTARAMAELAERDRSGEIFTAARTKVSASATLHGAGPSAEVNCPDRCQFSFDFIEPGRGRSRAVLHYDACTVQREREVQILLNGQPVGDSAVAVGMCAGDLRLPLPRQHLKPNAANTIVFDNKLVPGSAREWAIRKVWVEIEPIPDPDPKLARAKYDLARKAFDFKDIDPENISAALRYLKEARLHLEAIDPKPDLYFAVSVKTREVEQTLEQRCRNSLFAARRYHETGDWKQAESTLKSVQRQFEPEHHCWDDARVMLEEMIGR
jgi:hypothetical protein